MAKVDIPLTVNKWIDTETGKPTRFFYQFVLDLWKRTGGSTDEIEVTADFQIFAPAQVSDLEKKIDQQTNDLTIVLAARVAQLESQVEELRNGIDGPI